MTDEERRNEGAEETVEDLEAPAEEQDDVKGGACRPPTGGCIEPTKAQCVKPTCVDTAVGCEYKTKGPIVFNQ